MLRIPAVEVTLAWLLKGRRANEQNYFYRSSAFRDFPDPTIEVTSPDCGPGPLGQPARLRLEHSADGPGTMPSLEWKAPDSLSGKVKEWLVIVEDPDAPLPTPIPHGLVLYCGDAAQGLCICIKAASG